MKKLVLSFLILIGMFTARAGKLEQVTFSFNGATRYVIFYVPTGYNSADCYGLVVSLHGLGDNASNFSSVTALQSVGDSMHAVVAFPDGGNDTNRDFYSPAGDEEIITQVIAMAKQRYTINPKRVFMNGFSRGGRSAFLYYDTHTDSLIGNVLFTPVVYNGDGYPVSNWDNYNWWGTAGKNIYISVGKSDGWLPNVEAMAIYTYDANKNKCYQLYGKAAATCDCECDSSTNVTWYNTRNQDLYKYVNYSRWLQFTGGHTIPSLATILKMYRGIEQYADTGSFPPCPLNTKLNELRPTAEKFSVYPNPFSHSTSIALLLTKGSDVKAELFDLAGRRVATLMDTYLPAGNHEFLFTENELPVSNGAYLIRLTTGEGVFSTRLIKNNDRQ